MKQEVKNWLKKAEHDLTTSMVNFQEEIYDASAFFCQQAVEKALKALYIQKFKKLIRTHDLVYLGKKVNLPGELLEFCDDINSFYIETRYPDSYAEFEKDYVESFIKSDSIAKGLLPISIRNYGRDTSILRKFRGKNFAGPTEAQLNMMYKGLEDWKLIDLKYKPKENREKYKRNSTKKQWKDRFRCGYW